MCPQVVEVVWRNASEHQHRAVDARSARVTLPASVQMHVDQIVQLLGLQATRPSALEINLDREGIVQDVKPKLVFKRATIDADFYKRGRP